MNYFFLLFTLSLNALTYRELWRPTEYIWTNTLALAADHPYIYLFGMPPKTSLLHQMPPYPIKPYDTVYLYRTSIEPFAKHIFPFVEHPFILIVGIDDIPFPSHYSHIPEVMDMLASDKIVHIFAQDFDGSNFLHKVTPIPLGMPYGNFPSETIRSSTDVEHLFKSCLSEAPPLESRKVQVIADFHLNNTSAKGFWVTYFQEDRQAIYEQLQKNSALYFLPQRIQRALLWKLKTNYLFSISPPGIGLDCYRTWEDLALGLIVIVKSSPLDPLYKDLPVVIVQDWKEITEENLLHWKEQFMPLLRSGAYKQKLTNAYWIKKIHSLQQKYR